MTGDVLEMSVVRGVCVWLGAFFNVSSWSLVTVGIVIIVRIRLVCLDDMGVLE